MLKIASIVGTRPEFVKLAPLSKELRRQFKHIIIHTGQHYNYMLDKVFFNELGIPEPSYHLGIGSGTHGYQIGEMLKSIEEVLIKEKPDVVLVEGDTNSTLAGALVASKLNLKVGHVEAGMRSYDRRMPEEINRILTDHCSDLLFCPTKTAIENLKQEGLIDGVYLTGDITADVLKHNIGLAERKSMILNEENLTPKEYYLATLHRVENTDNSNKLENIVGAFLEIENLVFPCHPRTKRRLKTYGLWNELIEKVNVINPVGYLDMLILEKNAKKILTDSGGVQKEAYILQVPCITLRDTTEWIEIVENGCSVLVGANKERILERVANFNPGYNPKDIFGGGNASRKIAEILSWKN